MIVLVIITLIINVIYMAVCIQELLTSKLEEGEAVGIIFVFVPFVFNTIIAVWSVS